MSKEENIFYSDWKPLRNLLRKMGIASSLEALWWYSWHTFPLIEKLKSSRPVLPSMTTYSLLDNPQYPLLMWNIAMLANETILNGNNDESFPDNSLKNGKNFVSALNKLKGVENVVVKNTLDNANVLDEMFRIAHQQFKYQVDVFDYGTYIRYYRIWSYGPVESVLKRVIGIDANKMFSVSMMLCGHFLNHPSFNGKITLINDFGISQADIDTILNIISMPYKNLKIEVQEAHKLDNTYTYQYLPLTAYPLVNTGSDTSPNYICPIPFDLQMRVTRGIYYELFREQGFDNAFGESFQNYVGDVIKARTENTTNAVYDEEPEKIGQCDWVIDQENSFLMIECKTKRPTNKSYVELFDLTELECQLGILADAVVQAYTAYLNYKNRKYKNPQYQFDDKKNASVCVVTLEDWYIFAKASERFDGILRKKLSSAGIPEAIINDVPYAIMSIFQFEQFVYVIMKDDAYKLLSERRSRFSGYDTVGFLNTVKPKGYMDGYDYVFKNDLNNCFTPQIRTFLSLRRQ